MSLPYWNPTKLKRCVSSGSDIRAACNPNGDTVLHLAAGKGFVNTVKYILVVAPDLVDAENKSGNTALHSCFLSLRPSFRIVQLLLDMIKNPWTTDVSGRTILHLAARSGHPGHISQLLSNASEDDMERRDCYGCTPLMVAALYGNDRFICRLLDFGADPCTTDDANNGILDFYPYQTHVRTAIVRWCENKRHMMRKSLVEVFLFFQLLHKESHNAYASGNGKGNATGHITCLNDDVLNYIAEMVSREIETIDYIRGIVWNEKNGLGTYDRRENQLFTCIISLFVN